jgi:WD40 repeat protein
MNSIGLSRDGTTLATCGSSVNNEFVGSVKIWDTRSGELARDFAPENIHGRPMALSPDGSIIATGGKSIRLWEVHTGKMLRELYGHLKRTQSIVFSADGRLIFAGGSYGTTNLWEVATGKHLVTLFAFPNGQPAATTDDWLAYTPDGKYDGSAGAERFLAWRTADEFHTADRPSTQPNRPTRVTSALQLKASR